MSSTYAQRPTNGHGYGRRSSSPPAVRRPPLKSRAQMSESGKIRFFDGRRGYGFIERAGQPDVFIHASVVAQYGLRDNHLDPGTEVRFAFMQDAKRGPAADAICLAQV
jgi:cold shock protein